jgi:hypothetical protein
MMLNSLPRIVALITLLAIASFTVQADWSAKLSNSGYYTDDVALFSVTRRLSLKDDPTQPMVDRPNQGGDFVYEPSAEMAWSNDNSLGKMELSLDAGGYIFAHQSAFTHGLYEFQFSQTLPTNTKISLHYNFVPELFLGQNLFRQENGEEVERDERLNSHYGSLHVDQPITDNLTLRLLSRYGQRNYNAPFQHRDTQFWTLGSHLEWVINPDIELLVGYHYERGVADHQKASHFPDDNSFVNHYASAEVKIHLLEQLTGMFIVDYEKNLFTSPNIEDEHYGTAENLYQGEIELLYELTESSTVKVGWQTGSRQLTRENRVKNNNVWLGFEQSF